MSELSFKLPKYGFACIKLIREVKKGLEATDSILSQIQTHTVAHDGNTRQVSEPKILETSMKNYSVDLNIEKDCFLKTDTNKFRDFLWDLCESFSSQMKKYFYEIICKVTESTGNVFDAQGRNLWDAILEMTRNMPMCFDDEGNHNYQFHVNPETGKKLKENPPTPEQEKAMEELIKTKREEYYAQKRIRRLS